MNDQMRKHINTVENKEEINNFVNQIIVDTFLKEASPEQIEKMNELVTNKIDEKIKDGVFDYYKQLKSIMNLKS